MRETILDPKRERRIRAGMWALIVGGVVILLLVVFQYPKYLNLPFAEYGQGRGAWKSTVEQGAEKIQALKTSDTDGDGLVDFDEMYVYMTSVYLADSDSDGFSDKQEIESGNDPNCPAGETCSKISGEAASSAASGSLLGGGTTEINGFLSGQATADQVREALRQAGMSDDYLKKLDDKTLLELYSETIKESGGTSSTNTNTNSAAGTGVNTNAPASSGSMTAAQLREILKQNGIDEKTLNSFDDEALLKIYQESMKY